MSSELGLRRRPEGSPAAAERQPPDEVRCLGRGWPRADRFERLFWALVFLACAGCLAIAAFVLEPDRRGVGTHEQLGLPPCGFFDLAGGPCPSCGFTTTFAYAAHLRPLDALANQPFGFFVFLLACAATVVLPPAVVRGVSLFALTERWRWRWVVLGLVSAWLAAWAYKWHITVGF